MSNYTLVEKHAIEHHNEYYELRISKSDNQTESLYYTTNDENLETVAADIVATEAPGAQSWTVIPHRKDS